MPAVETFGQGAGVYLDAGAYHPIFGSNTLLLHKQGWRGVNVDLSPERIAAFNHYRPEDHNVVGCLSDRETEVEIAHYEIPSTDRIVDGQNPGKLSLGGQKPIRCSTARTTTLTAVLEESPFRFKDVQYLNVDCEGNDLAVLRGLDFERCHPKILSVEAFCPLEREAVALFLAAYGYRTEISIPPALIFVRRPEGRT